MSSPTSTSRLPIAQTRSSSRSPSRDGLDLSKAEQAPSVCPMRASRFAKVLSVNSVDMDTLRKLSWSGVSSEQRATVWLLMLQVLPASSDQWAATTQKRLASYRDLVRQFPCDADESSQTSQMQATLKQIRKDVPRTQPDIPLFQTPRLQEMILRILYIWSIRHPATGYVQGINDMLTPFIFVFLSDVFSGKFQDVKIETINDDGFEMIESKCFFCLTKVLEMVPDMYLFGQPGIQRMLFRFEQLIKRIDAVLYKHLTDQGVQFMQFAFRWMNCFLIRELPLEVVVRFWDSYIGDESNSGFTSFHVYISAALLTFYAPHLKTLEFPDLLLFLQGLPTKELSFRDVESILSQGFVYQSIFNNTKF